MSGSKRGRSFASKIFATAIGLSALAASPYTVSVGSATRSPFRRSSTARAVAALSDRRRRSEIAATVTVFTLAISQPRPLRTVSCETLLTFDEACYRMSLESKLREEPHFSRRPLLWPVCRRECHLAFALWTTANRVPGASIELAHREPAARCAL